MKLDLAVQFGGVSTKPRTTGRQRNRSNCLLSELGCRWRKTQIDLLIPINLSKIKRENELHIYDTYKLANSARVWLEVKRWKAGWELYPTHQVRSIHLCETLELISKKLYPHLYCILKILTMPPSTATTERSFSVLKHVNSFKIL